MPQTAQSQPTPGVNDQVQMAWPLALKMIMLHGIVVIDALLVSPLGETALAALGLAGAVAGLVLGSLGAFSQATQIRLAQAFGADSEIRLKTGFYCGLIINLAVACIGLVLVLILGEPIISGLAHSEQVATQSLRYLYVFVIVFFAEGISQCIGSYFNGCGKTRIPFFSYLISLPINVGVSLVLIHGLFGLPALGVLGAALGTVVAVMIRVLYMGGAFWHDTGAFQKVLQWSDGTLVPSIKAHLRFAWPIAGTFVSITIGNQVCVLIYANLSIYEFAAMTLIMPWVQVAGTVGMSWAQATGIIVAQLLGRMVTGAELDRFLGRAFKGALIAAGCVAVIYGVVCLGSAWIYSGLDGQTRTALLSFLPILLILPFPKGSNAICGQTLRAAGDTVYVMTLFIVSQWAVKVPATALLILVFEAPVFWVFSLFLVDELVKFPSFHLRLFAGKWKPPLEPALKGS